MQSGFDLSSAKGAIAALRVAAAEAVAVARIVLGIEERCRAWEEAFRAARYVAHLVGVTEAQIRSAGEDALARPLMELEAVRRETPPTDFTTAAKALESFQQTVVVRESLARVRSQHEERRTLVIRQLGELQAFLVNSGRLGSDAAEAVVLRALDEAKLPPDCLSNGVPVEEQPIVDLVARILRRERRAMTTTELVKALGELGRPIDARNPFATIRGAILARRDAVVVSAGRGLWAIRSSGLAPVEPEPEPGAGDKERQP